MSDSRHPRQLGRANPLVALIRKLARSPEERAAAGLMIVEGVHLADEALREGVAVRDAVTSPRLRAATGGAQVASRLAEAGRTVWQAGDSLLDSLHDAESPQGILLVVERPERALADLAPAPPHRALVLVACGVQDPGNMGALVRLADAAGATGMLAAGGADPFGPKAARASAGSIFRVPVARAAGASAGAVAVELARALRRGGALIAGAVPRGGISHREADLSCSLVLFVGSEGAGLPDEVEAEIDLRLTISINPRVESINVAAAAAVLLFEAAAPSRRAPTIPRGPVPAPAGRKAAPSPRRRRG